MRSFNLFKSIKYISLSNSAGILNNKEFHYNLTRPGIFLYGGYQNKRLKIINKSFLKILGKKGLKNLLQKPLLYGIRHRVGTIPWLVRRGLISKKILLCPVC